jgi:hypothetical protein
MNFISMLIKNLTVLFVSLSVYAAQAQTKAPEASEDMIAFNTSTNWALANSRDVPEQAATDEAPAAAKEDFCNSLLQVMKAADGGVDGIKSLVTEAYPTSDVAFKSSIQLPGSLEPYILNSDGYNYNARLEELTPEAAVEAKYQEWRTIVSDCIKGSGRPLAGYQGGTVNYYYESGDAVVKIEYMRNWAGTKKSVVTIAVYNTEKAFHYYRQAGSKEALHADAASQVTTTTTTSNGTTVTRTGGTTVTRTGGSTTSSSSGGTAGAYETFVFISDCSGNGQRNIKTVCRVEANLGKHSFDEVKAKASSLLNGSGRSCGGVSYLGKAADVKITGTPGRDYMVTEGMIMDF